MTMKTIIIEANDLVVDKLIESLNKFSNSEINYFIDDEDDFFSPQNEINYKKAKNDLKNKNVVTLEQLEKGDYIV